MSKWMRLARWTGGALLALMAGGSALLPRAASQAPAASELAADVDGDGQLDRVRWRRYGDDYWLDVALAQADGSFALRSSTRVAPATAGDAWTWSARDVDGDGRADILLRQGRAAAQTWISDGRGFSASSPPALRGWAALAVKARRE